MRRRCSAPTGTRWPSRPPRRVHAGTGVRFAVADPDHQPWPDGTFELVTCLDGPALPSLAELDRLVAELQRVATSDGLVLAALPVVAGGPGAADLEASLRRRFGAVAVLGQQVASSSVVWPLAPGRDLTTTTLSGRPPAPAPPGLEPAALLFVCSAAEIVPRLGTSHLVAAHPTAGAFGPVTGPTGAGGAEGSADDWQAQRRGLEAVSRRTRSPPASPPRSGPRASSASPPPPGPQPKSAPPACCASWRSAS